MISGPGQAQGIVEDEFAISRRSFGSHRRVDRDGGCDRLWADRPVRKARQAGEFPATRAGASAGSRGASPARAGDSGGSELDAGSLLAEWLGHSYLISNSDVDASKLRRWDDHE